MAASKRASQKSSFSLTEHHHMVEETKSVDLGIGRPDFTPPQSVLDALKAAAACEDSKTHQYPRGYGMPRLVKAISDMFSPLTGHDIDPMKEVLVTIGVQHGLFCCAMGLVDPGDEVIIIEPSFSTYLPVVKLAGGIPVYVPLKPSNASSKNTTADEWRLGTEELASKFNEKTKLLIFNNPHNPIGKVFTVEEMTVIADLCKKHNVIVVSDESYEWMVFKTHKFYKMAAIPGMWERTITLCSGTKMFMVTGWRIGWAIAPDHLLEGLRYIHTWSVFCVTSPIQDAIACGLETENLKLGQTDCFFHSLAAKLHERRDRLIEILTQFGMEPVVPDGGCFMLAYFRNVDWQHDGKTNDDVAYVKWLMKKKVSVLRVSQWYQSVSLEGVKRV